MKKKLIFVIPGLGMGGAEKSLVSLLNSLDYACFEVDLLLLTEQNVLLSLVPKEVNIIPLPEAYTNFSKGILTSVFSFILSGQWHYAFNRLFYSLQLALHLKNRNRGEQYSWKFLKPVLDFKNQRYDAAIAFLEKTSVYLVVDCIEADKKIGFIRTDYNRMNVDADFDAPYFAKLDYLCANGEVSGQILKSRFPHLADHIKVVKNIISSQNLRKLAEEEVFDEMNSDLILLSIGRLIKIKGYDISLQAAKMLKDQGLNFTWWIIGDGIEKDDLNTEIKRLDLERNVILLGQKKNPYPYMAKADIFVQTSYFEGKSSTVNEAKIFKKPIVVTNFESVFEQIVHEQNGLICEMKAGSVASGIIRLSSDDPLKDLFVSNLAKENLSTEEEINQFYKLING